MYCLDNEPMLWQEVHFDVHPEQTTYDEMLHMAVDYGAVVKEVDPHTPSCTRTCCPME